MGIFQARILKYVAMTSSRRSSQVKDQAQVSTLQADSLPSEPSANPENTGVGVLSLHPLIHPSSVHSWELPYPGIKLGFPALQADSSLGEQPRKTLSSLMKILK